MSSDIDFKKVLFFAAGAEWGPAEKRTRMNTQESKKEERINVLFSGSIFFQMLLNHHRFLTWWVQFARWASVRAAELCSFAADDRTASFTDTGNKGGKLINQPTERRE